jgi:hypothetical protein
MSPLDPLSLVTVVIHSSAAEIPSEGLFGSHDVVAGGVRYVEGFCWESDVERLSVRDGQCRKLKGEKSVWEWL